MGIKGYSDDLDMAKCPLTKQGATGPSSAPIINYGGEGSVLDAGEKMGSASPGSAGALMGDTDTALPSRDEGFPTHIMQDDVEYSMPDLNSFDKINIGVKGA